MLSYIVFILFILLPRSLQACAACGFADDGTQGAYLLTAGVLTLAPLIMFGGIVWWVRKKFNGKEDEHES